MSFCSSTGRPEKTIADSLTAEHLVPLSRIDTAPSFVFVRQGKVDALEPVIGPLPENPVALGIDPGGWEVDVVALLGVEELSVTPGTERTAKEFGGRHSVPGIHIGTNGHHALEIVDDEFVDVVGAAPHIGIALGIVGSWGNTDLVVVLLLIDDRLSVDGGHDLLVINIIFFEEGRVGNPKQDTLSTTVETGEITVGRIDGNATCLEERGIFDSNQTPLIFAPLDIHPLFASELTKHMESLEKINSRETV